MNSSTHNPAEIPHFLKKLNQETDKEFISLMNLGKYSEAVDVQKSLYQEFLNAQRKDLCRYHKGGPLHNTGYAYAYLNSFEKAFEYFLFAFTEDILTTEEIGGDPFEMPAALNLLNFLKQPLERLKLFQRLILTLNKKEKIMDPVEKAMGIIKDQANNKEGKKAISEIKRIEKWYSISNIPGYIQKRVFIGGKYGGELELIEDIKEIVLKHGFVPIIARECDMETDKLPRRTFTLLHNCEYAIFDVSQDGGHITEITQARQYELKILLVCRKGRESKVNKMTQGAEEMKIFRGQIELENFIVEFLKEN